MKTTIKLLSIILVISLSCVLGLSFLELPKVKPVNAPRREFSADRAMKYVKEIAANTHQLGSQEHANVKNYLISTLKKLGMKPEVQETFSENQVWGHDVSGYVGNVYTRLKGRSNSKNAILMTAHYDSTEGGPGAGDDASGVASLLETINNLKASPQLKNDVIFLFSDGEENGLLGAKAFIDENKLSKHLSMVMNFEARGDKGPVIMFETSKNNGWFMNEFKKAVPYPVAYSSVYDIYKNMPNDTDFTLYKKAGNPGFNFALFSGVEAYHNGNDTPKNLSRQSLQHEGSYSLNLVKHFGNLPLKNIKQSDAVYFTLTKNIFIMYSEKLAIPFAFLSFILLIIVFVLGLSKKLLSIKGTIIGVLFALVNVGIGVGIGTIVHIIFDNLYSKVNFNIFPEEFRAFYAKANLYVLVAIIITLLIVCLLCWFVNRKVQYINLFLGTILIQSILTLTTSFLFKSTSYIFTWPTIFILLVTLLKFVLNTRNKGNCGCYILMVVTIVSTILIYVPEVYLLYVDLSIDDLAIITGAIVVPISNIVLCSYLTMEKTSSNEMSQPMEQQV